jgi:ABC-2 type transport system ATP-binding protein
MSEPLALEAIQVSKRYGTQQVLRDADLIAYRGGIHGLLGPNGAGKTTLMGILLGLIRRDAGTVRLLGRSLHSVHQSLPDKVAGFVETPGFYPYLSGRRNLELLGRLDDNRAGATVTAGVALEQVGLGAQADAAVAVYSAGMRQRLGLAAALMRSPQLLLLDEPTSTLDVAAARDVRDTLRRASNEGAAVVFSSHDMAEVESLCTALTIIDRGRVIFSGTVAGLRALAPGAIHLLRTSDDRAALDIASQHRGVIVAPVADGLEITADDDARDSYVIALGRAGVAVRVLERRARSLESLFLDVTSRGASDVRPAGLHGSSLEPSAARVGS